MMAAPATAETNTAARAPMLELILRGAMAALVVLAVDVELVAEPVPELVPAVRPVVGVVVVGRAGVVPVPVLVPVRVLDGVLVPEVVAPTLNEPVAE